MFKPTNSDSHSKSTNAYSNPETEKFRLIVQTHKLELFRTFPCPEPKAEGREGNRHTAASLTHNSQVVVHLELENREGAVRAHLLVPDDQVLVDNFQCVLFANVVVANLQNLSKAPLSYAPYQGEVCKREVDPAPK